MATTTTSSKKTAAKPHNKRAGLTKQEALRQAIGDLGKDAKPLQLQGHIKKKFGIEISTAHISAVKTGILRKMAGETKPAPVKPAAVQPATAMPAAAEPTAPKAAARVTAAPKPAAKRRTRRKRKVHATVKVSTGASVVTNGKAAGGISLGDIQVAKELVGRVGASQLRQLIDLLAK